MNRAEIITHLIEMITEAGYDYHDYNIAGAAKSIEGFHENDIMDGMIAEDAPVALPDTATIWDTIHYAAWRESAPDLLHLAA